jgi:hypothetical protein
VTQTRPDQPAPALAPESAGHTSAKPWHAVGWVRATVAVAVVAAIATGVALSTHDGSTPTAKASASGSTVSSPPTVPATSNAAKTAKAAEALKNKQAAREDKQAAREDEQGDGSATPPPGTYRLGSVGTYLVGKGIAPGTYKSAAPTSGKCHWARLSGATNSAEDIIAKRSSKGPSIVKIKATDKFFETRGCENWLKVR